MNDFGAPDPSDVLQYAIDAVNDVVEARLTPEKWEKFTRLVALMGEALDRGDLAEVQRRRQEIEALEPLHGVEAKLTGDRRVGPARRLRGQAEYLTGRMAKAKAEAEEPGSTDERRA